MRLWNIGLHTFVCKVQFSENAIIKIVAAYHLCFSCLIQAIGESAYSFLFSQIYPKKTLIGLIFLGLGVSGK